MNKPFDPTKPVRTKAGTQAVICYNSMLGGRVESETYPLLVEYKTKEGDWRSTVMTADGRMDIHVAQSDYDLENIPEKIKLTGWVNVYGFEDGAAGISDIYKSKQDANDGAGHRRIASVDLSNICCPHCDKHF